MADRTPADDELNGWIVSTVQRALAFAMSLLRNRVEAEDVVHDCYGRLLARADKYDLPRDGSKLLFKAISNACINVTTRRDPTVSLDAPTNSTDGDAPSLAALALADKVGSQPEQQAMHRELEAALEAALGELPTMQRAVIELRGLGFALVDVAEMLEISDANARTLLHRGRTRLAQLLRPFLEESIQ